MENRARTKEISQKLNENSKNLRHLESQAWNQKHTDEWNQQQEEKKAEGRTLDALIKCVKPFMQLPHIECSTRRNSTFNYAETHINVVFPIGPLADLVELPCSEELRDGSAKIQLIRSPRGLELHIEISRWQIFAHENSKLFRRLPKLRKLIAETRLADLKEENERLNAAAQKATLERTQMQETHFQELEELAAKLNLQISHVERHRERIETLYLKDKTDE